MHCTRKLKLLHLDLKTVYSYGDQLLFELVRHVFNGFADGTHFDLLDTLPFRAEFDARMIDSINEKYDGVVIGGGGLFPLRTNASTASGWQWNCSVELVKRLKKPIIVFGVGNPPRYSQAMHSRVFERHINATVSRSAFCGLRSQGAVDSLKAYLVPELQDKVTFQPCPTTIGATLLPEFCYPAPTGPNKRLALQFGLEEAHKEDGLLPENLHPRLVNLITRLRTDGWVIEFVGHKRSDMAFANERGRELRLVSHKLFGRVDVLFEGARTYGRYPIVLGARGHSQMIPFGLGSIPLSFGTNDKIRYFAQHVGHPEWLVDPWSGSLEDAACRAVQTAYENQDALRRDMRAVQATFLEATVRNLSAIYQALSGASVDDSQKFIAAQSAAERHQSLKRYRASYAARGEGM